jgi:hypothetical protein
MNKNQPYWSYETSIGNELSVSIRMRTPVRLYDYKIFLLDFIDKYKNRIFNKPTVILLSDGSLVCIIRLNGRGEITFTNHEYW